MGEAAKVAENGAGPFVPRIREHLERGDLQGARRVLAEAQQKKPDEPGLEPFARLLAPLRARVVDERGRDRTAEFRWLDTEGHSYRGEWVALLGDELVAHSPSFKDLRDELDRKAPEGPVLLHFIG
jgi:hypothetical protein